MVCLFAGVRIVIGVAHLVHLPIVSLLKAYSNATVLSLFVLTLSSNVLGAACISSRLLASLHFDFADATSGHRGCRVGTGRTRGQDTFFALRVAQHMMMIVQLSMIVVLTTVSLPPA